MALALRDVDIALTSYPEAEWIALARPPLLPGPADPGGGEADARVGVDADEAYGAVRRASYLAAAAGDPGEGDDAGGPAVAAIADELHTRERVIALADAVRASYGRATAERLPRVESVLRELVASPGDAPLRACQAPVSTVQWGLGALGPQLARSYGLSNAGLGALISATSVGNAVALVGAG